jgi:23S rRNA pseudouridine2605 synthase
LTAEQLEASRSERMRQNGRGQLTYEDARTWLEETGLCLFLPRKQFTSFVAPSFVEAVGGERNSSPPARIVSLAEELLIRLETEGVAVRLNLLGQPGEQPDFVVAAWVLPFVYALRGDRDWRRSPQLTGSRQVSPLAIQTYKLLEAGDATIPQLKHQLGREVTESGVLRAITELWQQLRIIPVVSTSGKPAHWQLLRLRFQKAIAEGASTSQVTAISVLASIYLQAVIAASMEEVELFLAPLTARSKVREVLRGLLATRQVHTISLGHAPHFYVAGTLPEFSAPPTIYASSAMASSSFLRSYERQEEPRPYYTPAPSLASAPLVTHKPVESLPTQVSAAAKPEQRNESPAAGPHFSHQPAPGNGAGRVGRRDTRSVASRAAGAHTNGGSRHAHKTSWSESAAKNGHSKHNRAHSNKSAGNGSRLHANGSARTARTSGSAIRKAKPAAARTPRQGQASAKGVSKSVIRRKDVRGNPRSARGNRKSALAAAAKSGNRARYGFTAPSRKSAKKRG